MFTTLLRRSFAVRLLSMSLIAAAGVAFAAAPAVAAPQASGGTHVGVVNAQKVYNEMQETKALTTRMAEENKRLKGEDEARQAALQKLRQERDTQFKPGTAQYADMNKKLIQQSADYKIWRETQQALLEDAYKQQVRQLFDKVQSAIAEVAKRENYDIVVADTSERLPDALDQVDLRALKAMLLQKSVLYASEKSDITQSVIIVLDAKFNAAAAGGK